MNRIEEMAVKSLLNAREGILKEHEKASAKAMSARAAMDAEMDKVKAIKIKLASIENAIRCITPDALPDVDDRAVTSWIKYMLQSGGMSLASLQTAGEAEGYSNASIKL